MSNQALRAQLIGKTSPDKGRAKNIIALVIMAIAVIAVILALNTFNGAVNSNAQAIDSALQAVAPVSP